MLNTSAPLESCALASYRSPSVLACVHTGRWGGGGVGCSRSNVAFLGNALAKLLTSQNQEVPAGQARPVVRG